MKILKTIFHILYFLIKHILIGIYYVLQFIYRVFFKKKDEHDFKASFGSVWSLLSIWNKGLCLGSRRLTVETSQRGGVLVVGGTGSGKTSRLLLNTALSTKGSFVLNDPSQELYPKSSGYFHQIGKHIDVVNFVDHRVSSGYNPMYYANTFSEYRKIAHTLITNSYGSSSKDNFWNIQSVELISMLIAIVKEVTQPLYQNLANVRHLLNLMGSKPESVDRLFVKTESEALYESYASFLNYDQKVVSSVIATCKGALSLWGDEEIAKVTSVNTIDFDRLRREPSVIFLQARIADLSYYAPILALFHEQLFSYLMSRFKQPGEQNINILIDECSAMKLSTLQTFIANCRKHSATAMCVIQDFNQLIHHYGKYEAEAIKSNMYTKVYLPGTGIGLDSARELEGILGKYTYEDDAGSKRARPLMTADELRLLDDKYSIVIAGNKRPVKMKLIPYYKQWKLKRRSELQAPRLQQVVPDVVPLIKIPEEKQSLHVS